MVFNGSDYSIFSKSYKNLTDVAGCIDLKDKGMKSDGNQCVNLRVFFIFETMSNCQENDQEVWDWNMEDLMDQHDADRSDCNCELMRKLCWRTSNLQYMTAKPRFR